VLAAEVMAEIRHDLRLLSTELAQALSPVEHEAFARIMLDEQLSGRLNAAKTRVRGKASRLLGYEWAPVDRKSAVERKRRAFELFADGHSAREVARRVGVSRSAVNEWRRQARRDQLKVAA
jgi:DNA invertase Pin-like site-specific DNA recombinase